MSNRSQRHLRENQGYDSSGQAYYITGPVWDGTPIVDRADETGLPYDFSAVFTTDSSQPIEYGAGILPAGLVVDSETGIISGTATAPAGDYLVRLSGKDGYGVNYTNRFTWTIT